MKTYNVRIVYPISTMENTTETIEVEAWSVQDATRKAINNSGHPHTKVMHVSKK